MGLSPTGEGEYTRVIEMSAADVGLGPTLDRHYSDVGGQCRQRPTLLRHSADVGVQRRPMPTLH